MFRLVTQQITARFENQTASPQGIYITLFECIRQLIEERHLPGDTLLPPTRLLSSSLKISRSTVVKAYNLLAENQLVTPRQGSGFWVKELPGKRNLPKSSFAEYPQISETGRSFLHNIHLLNNSPDEGLAFTPGLPPVDVFPIHQWQKLSNLYWRTIKSADLNYSVSSGIGTLKKSIADYLLLSRRIQCDPEQVIIVSGSLQSLYLLGVVLVEKGDVVYMENPTFPNVISIFKSLQAEVVPVPVDEEGINVDNMPNSLHRKAKLVHVTPSNQYPLGGKMSCNRRQKLLQWASENQAYIIENDYEHEINNRQKPEAAVFSLDKEERTIYLGTFNRLLHPSIRLGYMVLPTHLLPVVKPLQMHSHRFVPQSIQVVMTEFIQQRLLYRHIRMAIDVAAERKEYFESLFKKWMPDTMILQKMEVPSFHLLAMMPDNSNDQALVSALETKGVMAHALSKCYVGGPEKRGLILGYSCVNKGFMNQILGKMAQVVSEQ